MLDATRKASGAGTVLALVLMGLGLFSALSGGGIGGAWLVLIGFFVLNASRGAYQRLLVQDSLRGRRVAELMTADPWTAAPEATLAEVADGVMLTHAVSFVPVVAGERVMGYIDAGLMRAVPREDWARATVGEVMAQIDDSCVIAPRASAEEALTRLAQGPQRKLIVVEGRELRGVLSLRDLMGHIAVVQSLGGGMRPGRRAGR